MKISSQPTQLEAWDFSIRSFDGCTLEIAAGIETSLHTDPSFVLRFSEVDYIDCPTLFSHASIRLATAEETLPISERVPLDGGEIVYAIDAETMGDLVPQTFFVVAEDARLIDGDGSTDPLPGQA